jgi:hypothetical protein
MLVSHTHKFIYLKTKKTGGTSVEAYLEQFCLPPDTVDLGDHNRVETISEYGIAGARHNGRKIKEDQYWNHMSAKRLRSLLGEDVWKSYYKICVIRNPWDRMVSKFWWTMHSIRKKIARKPHMPFDEVRESFEWFIDMKPRWLADDLDVFTIGDEVIVDDVIRYEDFDNEVARICENIGEVYKPDTMPKYKSGYRIRPNPYQDYYTNPKTLATVTEAHRVWIDHFGYTF